MTIINGKDTPLDKAAVALPNVGGAVAGWMQKMTFGVVCKSQVDGFTQEIITPVETKGVKQPFTAEQLSLLPEGERSWKWFMIHCLPDVKLATDDRIVLDDVKYRVMAKEDWSEYGFLQYNIIEDFND